MDLDGAETLVLRKSSQGVIALVIAAFATIGVGISVVALVTDTPQILAAEAVAGVFVALTLIQAFQTTQVNSDGIRGQRGLTPWRELVAYGFDSPDRVNLVRRGHTLNAPEDVAVEYCPRTAWVEVEARIRTFAPHARRLGVSDRPSG